MQEAISKRIACIGVLKKPCIKFMASVDCPLLNICTSSHLNYSPEIDVRPSRNQIDDLLEEIDERVKKKERVLVTTLTKRMAEELTKYMERVGVKCRYIHSEVKTLDRVEILRELEASVVEAVNLSHGLAAPAAIGYQRLKRTQKRGALPAPTR